MASNRCAPPANTSGSVASVLTMRPPSSRPNCREPAKPNKIANVEVVSRGDANIAKLGPFRAVVNHDEPIDLRQVDRMEEQGIGCGENRRIGGDR